ESWSAIQKRRLKANQDQPGSWFGRSCGPLELLRANPVPAKEPSISAKMPSEPLKDYRNPSCLQGTWPTSACFCRPRFKPPNFGLANPCGQLHPHPLEKRASPILVEQTGLKH